MNASKEITNSEDIIDSRDIIARVEYLESDIETLDEEETAELAALKSLCEECEGYGDWQYGEALIRDSYFTEYAQDLAEDTGAIDKDAKWPNNCIDWDKAVRELKYDYSCVSFDGVDYWLRS